MARILGIMVILIIVVMAIILIFSMRGPDLTKFEYLKEPQINTISAQKMLVVEVTGDPNEIGREAFSRLFKTFYQLRKSVKGIPMAAPRIRWPDLATTPKKEWVGIYGLPIPDEVKELPEGAGGEEPEVKITTWEYGKVAEILHIGPYSEETPTIERLMSFVTENGYEIIGPHEEEYLKGPGMFFKGNPNKYYTIIRYQVRKLEEE